MKSSLIRLLCLILLGAVLTPMAGYVGSITMPGSIALWFFGVIFAAFTNVKGAVVLFFLPAYVGAKFSWPLTCVVLPLAGMFFHPATVWTPFALLGIGLVAGALVAYITTVAHFVMYIHPNNIPEFAIAGAVAGAVIGMIFGYVLWRFDRVVSING